EPALRLAERFGDAHELGGSGKGTRDRLAFRCTVENGARSGEAECACGDGFGDDIVHSGDGLGAGRFVVQAFPTHRPVAHGTMAHQTADVHAFWYGVQSLQIFAIGLPLPRHPGNDGVRWDVLDRFHQVCHVLAVLRAAGCERASTVAHHHRSDAMPAGRRCDRVPENLRVQVGVDVDESWGDDVSLGVDDALGARGNGPYLGDAITLHRNVGAIC